MISNTQNQNANAEWPTSLQILRLSHWPEQERRVPPGPTLVFGEGCDVRARVCSNEIYTHIYASASARVRPRASRACAAAALPHPLERLSRVQFGRSRLACDLGLRWRRPASVLLLLIVKRHCILDMDYRRPGSEVRPAVSLVCRLLGVPLNRLVRARALSAASQHPRGVHPLITTDRVCFLRLPTNRPPLIEAGCFFRFVLAPPPPSPAPLLTENEAQVQVALDAAQLPFAGPAMRRNVKILKMLGDRFFPWARVLLWADGKLQPGRVRPFDFHLTARNATGGACATFLRLPPHRYAFGKRASRLPPSSLTLALHADTVIKSARSRKSVSDSLSTVHTQLAEYRAAVPEIDAFSTAALIDSAYFVRDGSSTSCRHLNAALGCAWLSEIACYSDRDQLSFPMACERQRGGVCTTQSEHDSCCTT